MIKSMKRFIGSIPVFGPLLKSAYRFNKPKLTFANSGQYWDDRYKIGRNSGTGSYNRLAEFKADYLNGFVTKNQVKTVVEFGCGDGNQLSIASYPKYRGYDISATAIEMCKKKFSGDNTKEFMTLEGFDATQFDLSMSLDVVYHLVEDKTFNAYMEDLFNSSSKFVIVYASNKEEKTPSPHVRHRQFTKWVDANKRNWSLIEKVDNHYPYQRSDPDNTSFADFYVFKKSN
jgi:2-polyprenyl-3-methyl-5-hydroxy-6-metoxy-1,4-benzoquinol methylase